MRASGGNPGARRRARSRYGMAATRAHGAAGIHRTAAGTGTTSASREPIRGQGRPDPGTAWVLGFLVRFVLWVPVLLCAVRIGGGW